MYITQILHQYKNTEEKDLCSINPLDYPLINENGVVMLLLAIENPCEKVFAKLKQFQHRQNHQFLEAN